MDIVAYLRVSTVEQYRHGAGIEVQRAEIARFCRLRGWTVDREYVEAASGRRHETEARPQLEAALAHARRTSSPLVVARLDRLARSVLVVSRVLAAGIAIVAVDAPDASTLFLQLSALMAEYESRLISERTKAGMAAARLRGISFDRTHWRFTPEMRLKAAVNAAASHRRRAREAYADIAREAVAARQVGSNWTKIARYLNARGHTTRTGGAWSIASVQRLVRREIEYNEERRLLTLEDFREVTRSLGERRRSIRPKTVSLERPSAATVGPRSGRAVAYCRVSTDKQSVFGYSLEAQEMSIRAFCDAQGLAVVGSYVDAERAWRAPLENRPRLREAIAHARAADAHLVIGRLDRLARNVSVVSALLREGVRFVAADAPWATEFSIMILAAIAQEESRLISERMKAVRAQAKASGRAWHHACNLRHEDHAAAVAKSREVRRARTKLRDEHVGPIAAELRNRGMSLVRIASELSDRGLRTTRNTPFRDTTVLYLLRRLGIAAPHRPQASSNTP